MNLRKISKRLKVYGVSVGILLSSRRKMPTPKSERRRAKDVNGCDTVYRWRADAPQMDR